GGDGRGGQRTRMANGRQRQQGGGAVPPHPPGGRGQRARHRRRSRLPRHLHPQRGQHLKGEVQRAPPLRARAERGDAQLVASHLVEQLARVRGGQRAGALHLVEIGGQQAGLGVFLVQAQGERVVLL